MSTRQPLNSLEVTCLGDGHDGIRNPIGKFNPGWQSPGELQTRMSEFENLYKVAGSRKRLSKAKELLWQERRTDETLKLFELCKSRQTTQLLQICHKTSESNC